MQSVRRAAFRTAVSASRAASFKPQTTSFAAELFRNASVVKACAIPATRFFSQSARFLEENAADQRAVNEAIKSSEEVGSTGQDAAVAQSTSTTPQNDDPSPYGVFIRNVVFDATEQHLAEAFEKYGTVVHSVIAKDQRGLSKGFAFVWFDNAEAMNRATAEGDGSFWHGRRIQVGRRVKTEKRVKTGAPQPTNSLYIGNIPYETTDTELNRIFRGLDNVTDIRVAVDRSTGWPRGFAHADFVDVESAVKAKEQLEGMVIGTRELRFDYAAPATKKYRNAIADTPPEHTV